MNRKNNLITISWVGLTRHSPATAGLIARHHVARSIVFIILAAGLFISQGFAAPRKIVELSHWQLSDGSVHVSSARQPLIAAADRLLVGIGPSRTRIYPLSLRQFHTESVRLATAAGGEVSKLLGGGRIAVVELPPGTDLYTAAARIAAAGADFVEPDLAVQTARIPNDTRYSNQYHHPQINSPSGWDVTIGSSGVVIAVIDSGVDTDHPDLRNSIWINADESPGNGIDDDGNGYVDDWRGWDFQNDNNNPNPEPDGLDNDNNGEPDDQVSHGTLVAGLAAAIGNDNYGTVGVSWRATIMALQVFPDDGTTYVSTVVEAIDYAVDNGADIINLSIGSPYEESFSAPIERAYEAGIVVVCAAGNAGEELTNSESTWTSPVCNDGPNVFADNYILGVTGVDSYDKRAWYSNFDTSSASFVDVSAPGSAMFGPNYYDPTFSHLDSYFGTNTGTSFACPLASGLAALVLTRHPGYTPAQVYQVIRNNADNIDGLNPGYAGTLGTGRINCGRTLGQILAPAAVTNFQAHDTPNDDGGSITLTWTKSADDGSGANSLTAYLILRRQGESGNFQQVADLPPGTTTYVDTDVSDGQTYYYIVRSTDGTLTSDSETSDGVIPQNDGAPAPIDDLSALDRANDDGGAIVLAWPGYTPPADFASYCIYRSERNFSSTLGLTLMKSITDSNTSTWTDNSTQDGVDYYYAVGVRDTASNEQRNLQAVGPVQSYPNNNIPLGPGLLFIGPPAVPPDRDPATLLNIAPQDLQAARWDTAAGEYVTYSPGSVPEVLKLALGRGFWVQLDQVTVIQPTGATAPGGDFAIALTPGWHQLGNPFFAPLDFGASTVTYNSNTMDLTSAEAAGIMRCFAWIYSPAEGQYRLAYPDVGQTSSLIPPWTGFWVKVLQPCTLTLARPGGTTAAAPTSAARADAIWAHGWHAQVVLRAGGAVDANNYVGTAQSDYTIASPPPINNRPQLYLSAANRDEDFRPYAISLGAETARRWVWSLDINNLQPGTEVEVVLPDLSGVPNNYSVTLHDPLTGKSTYIRTAAGYRFTARSERPRRLQLIVKEKGTGSLVINSMSVQPAGSGTVHIVFSLSQPAETTVEVLNIAGRCVRKIEQQYLRLAGNHTILFDGHNSYGAPVPGGRYLVAVNARAENGQQVRRLMSISLSR